MSCLLALVAATYSRFLSSGGRRAVLKRGMGRMRRKVRGGERQGGGEKIHIWVCTLIGLCIEKCGATQPAHVSLNLLVTVHVKFGVCIA